MEKEASEFLSYWGLQSFSMLATAALLPKLRITNPLGAILMVAALGAVNATIWDGALFFNIPNTFTHHTITLLLSNGVLFWVLVKLLPGIEMDGVLTAVVAPLVFTVLSLLIHHHGKNIEWKQVSEMGFNLVKQFRDGLLAGR